MRPRNGIMCSTEYNICYYISKCSFQFIDHKSGVCHHVKPCISLKFKMVPQMATKSIQFPPSAIGHLRVLFYVANYFEIIPKVHEGLLTAIAFPRS